jgi:pimeloyl-ACP methyl ester carboxylesterase
MVPMVYLLAGLAAAGGLGYLFAAFALYRGQAAQVYKPLRDMVDAPAAHGLPYEDFEFRAADGTRLHGWYVPRPGARRVLMFFHGNTRNISYCLDSVLLFHRLGFNVFLFDYRGYGLSGGVPDEGGTYLDAEAAWQYLSGKLGIAPEDVVMLGRSLGAAIACWLAARHEPRALVIESTFTSLPDAAAEHYPYLPVRLLARYRYPVADHLPRIHCPLLIVHSPDDEIIRFEHATRLFALANEPKELLRIEGRHYDGYRTSGAVYEEGLARFFSRYAAERSEGPPPPF